jgi:NADH-quinone oxidoreductase subunit C
MTPEEVLARTLARFPRCERAADAVKDYPTIAVSDPGDLPEVARFLKEDLGFSALDMVTAVDWKGPVDPAGFPAAANPHAFLQEPVKSPPLAKAPGPVPYRDALTLVVLLGNLESRLKVFLKTDLPRSDARAGTLTRLFRSADWQEREAFDLLGVVFEGHANLKKILTPEFLQGHPLRKDYAHVRDELD